MRNACRFYSSFRWLCSRRPRVFKWRRLRQGHSQERLVLHSNCLCGRDNRHRAVTTNHGTRFRAVPMEATMKFHPANPRTPLPSRAARPPRDKCSSSSPPPSSSGSANPSSASSTRPPSARTPAPPRWSNSPPSARPPCSATPPSSSPTSSVWPPPISWRAPRPDGIGNPKSKSPRTCWASASRWASRCLWGCSSSGRRCCVGSSGRGGRWFETPRRARRWT
mmetsp:Transcript_29446/g.61939  ORF Transcript_29446/g.61939 Transcript_29446/m.61939 type:complete len:222 (+) Transcript_29446:220-885(+)